MSSNKATSAAPAATQIGQVEVVGAGTHEVDGHYRTTRIGTDPRVLAAYMSNTGYRLLLCEGLKGKSNQWQITHPSDASKILYF